MSDEQQQPEQPQQPTFPATSFNLQPNGLIITTMLAPDLHIMKFVDASFLNELTVKWHEIQKQQKQELQVLQDIKANKGRENLQLLKGVKR